MEKRMGIQKPVFLLVAALLVFSSAVVACGPTPTPPTPFILVGTDNSSTQRQGNILLYGFNSSSLPIFASNPMVVANFTGGIVQGLDILDYEGDGDLDFIALVRFEAGNSTDVWRYEVFFFENNRSQYSGTNTFTMTMIPNTLPQISGAWNAALADSTAAEFDNPPYPYNEIDFIVSIGNATATMIYKFQNTRHVTSAPPFTQLNTTITEDWATHARRMDSADFDGEMGADFATFDYPHGGDFQGQVVAYNHGTDPFGSGGEFFANLFTYTTPHAIQTITAGQFNNDTAPDVIVGGDDDGDPGQYWLYLQLLGGGSFTFGTPSDVFDLNQAAETGEGRAGGGVADAYDFNADGMMDVVATAGDMTGTNTSAGFTTIWFVARKGPGTFWVSDPDIGIPVAPSSVIDIISTAEYGNVWSIAAPMTTQLGVG